MENSDIEDDKKTEETFYEPETIKNEDHYTRLVVDALKNELDPEYSVFQGKNLQYSITVDPSGKLTYYPDTENELKRGIFAYQTDIMIKENNIPIVVIEVKYKHPITHDIITYSQKALEHKRIYPYLRYGLLIGGATLLPNRFFHHNVGFDFALTAEAPDSDSIKNIIKEQIDSAHNLMKIYEAIIARSNKFSYYSTSFDLKSQNVM